MTTRVQSAAPMGDAMKRVTTTHRHVYELRAPTPYVEVLKALNWASMDFEDVKGRPVQYDDDIWVVGDEERITVYFDAEQTDAKGPSPTSTTEER